MSNFMKGIALVLTVNTCLMASELVNNSINYGSINNNSKIISGSIGKINIIDNTKEVNNINYDEDTTKQNKKLLTDAIADINNKYFIEAKRKLRQFLNNVPKYEKPTLPRNTIIKCLKNANNILSKSNKIVLNSPKITKMLFYKSINATRDILLELLQNNNINYRCYSTRSTHDDVEHLMLHSNHIFRDIGKQNKYLEFIPIQGIELLPYYEEIHQLVKCAYNKIWKQSFDDVIKLIYSIVDVVIVTPILIDTFDQINSDTSISTIYLSGNQNNNYEYPLLILKIILTQNHNEIKFHLKYVKDKEQLTVQFDTLYGNTEESYNFEKDHDERTKQYKQIKNKIFDQDNFEQFSQNNEHDDFEQNLHNQSAINLDESASDYGKSDDESFDNESDNSREISDNQDNIYRNNWLKNKTKRETKYKYKSDYYYKNAKKKY